MKPESETFDFPIITPDHLMAWYHVLLNAHGHQHWWPSDGWFETIIGAILAQNVAWSGARKAVFHMRDAGLLDPKILAQTDQDLIAPLIYSSRYYNQKAARIRIFSQWFMKTCQGEIGQMEKEDVSTLRTQLLSLHGFGPETVDSILLYACNKPVFVVDAYTRRIGSRIGWYPESFSYHQMQQFFIDRLEPEPDLFNDFHAQIVNLGSRTCKKNPDCTTCPVRWINTTLFCLYGKEYHTTS